MKRACPCKPKIRETENKKLNLTRSCDYMDMIRILQFAVLVFGVKELSNALAYHKQKKKKWAIASLCIGVFACACAVVSMTGIL